jgi:hypothetical protein
MFNHELSLGHCFDIFPGNPGTCHSVLLCVGVFPKNSSLWVPGDLQLTTVLMVSGSCCFVLFSVFGFVFCSTGA